MLTSYRIFASQMEKGQLSLLPVAGAWCCNLPPNFFLLRYYNLSTLMSFLLILELLPGPISAVFTFISAPPFLHFAALLYGLPHSSFSQFNNFHKNLSKYYAAVP